MLSVKTDSTLYIQGCNAIRPRTATCHTSHHLLNLHHLTRRPTHDYQFDAIRNMFQAAHLYPFSGIDELQNFSTVLLNQHWKHNICERSTKPILSQYSSLLPFQTETIVINPAKNELKCLIRSDEIPVAGASIGLPGERGGDVLRDSHFIEQ